MRPSTSSAQSGSRRARSAQRSLPGFLSGIDLAPHKTLRLAVSGDVSFNRLETRCIDTADFQRLRSIKQLGTTYTVYPSAVHTRFEHSLGVVAMADRMIRVIRENRSASREEREISFEEEQLIRLYALLHDITHVPFGHTIEDEFCIFPRHDESRERIERFLGEESEIGRTLLEALGSDLYARFRNLLFAGAGDEDALASLGDDFFILDFITNTVCADLLDYLKRDAYFCNVSLDCDYRFLRHLAICRYEGRRRMVIKLWKDGKSTPRRDVLNELIRLLDNRYLMGERAYFHHTKLVTGAMLAAAVARSATEGEITKHDLWEMGDDVLLWKLRESKIPHVRHLAQQFDARRLWRPVYERDRSEIRAEQQSTRDRDVLDELMRTYHSDATARVALEDRVAGLLGMDPGDLLFHCPHHKMAMKSAEILVFWNGSLRALKDCADDALVGAKLESILASHQNLWAVRVFVNPEHEHRHDAIASACDYLFTFEPSRRRRFATTFYRSVVDSIAREERLDPAAHETAVNRGVERLLGLPEASRTREAARAFLAG